MVDGYNSMLSLAKAESFASARGGGGAGTARATSVAGIHVRLSCLKTPVLSSSVPLYCVLVAFHPHSRREMRALGAWASACKVLS